MANHNWILVVNVSNKVKSFKFELEVDAENKITTPAWDAEEGDELTALCALCDYTVALDPPSALASSLIKQNDERIRGDADALKQRRTPSPSDDAACSHLGLFGIACGIIPKRFTKGTRRAFFLLLALFFLPYGVLEQVYYRIKLVDNSVKLRRGTWLLYGWGRAVAYAVGVCHLFSNYRVMNNKDLFGCQDILFPANGSHHLQPGDDVTNQKNAPTGC